MSELLNKLDQKRAEHATSSDTGVAPARPTVSDAVGRFLASKGVTESDGAYRGDVERGTYRKYNTFLQFLASFCLGRGIVDLDAVGNSLEEYRWSRKIRTITWKVERQTLVTFFAYCILRNG